MIEGRRTPAQLNFVYSCIVFQHIESRAVFGDARCATPVSRRIAGRPIRYVTHAEFVFATCVTEGLKKPVRSGPLMA